MRCVNLQGTSISILFSLLKAEKHICHIKQMTIFVMTNIEIM